MKVRRWYKELVNMEGRTVMDQNVIRDRIRQLRDQMKQHKIDVYLIPTGDYHSSEYVNDYFKVREFFSGFTGSNGTLVVTIEECGLWTDGRYFIQAEKELFDTEITLYKMAEEGVPTVTQYLERVLNERQTLGFDGRVISAMFGLSLEDKLKEKNIAINFEATLEDVIWTDRPIIHPKPLFCLSDSICGKTVEEKIDRVREEMKQQGVSYFFLSKLDDLMWLFNVRGSDIPCNPVGFSYGFITMDSVYLFIYQEAYTKELEEYGKINKIQLGIYQDITLFLKQFPYELNHGIWVDAMNCNYSSYKTILNHCKGKMHMEHNPTEMMKAVKNPIELGQMKAVYLKDSVIVTKFIFWLKKKMKEVKENSICMLESEVSDYLDKLRSEEPDFLDLSFPTICAYQENAAMMHYEAEAKKGSVINANGMLLVDSGGQYLGGTTDVTRTIILGPISSEMKKDFTLVAVGMLRLLNAQFIYGCTGRNLDILARQPLWEQMTDYKCGTGHGIGYILNVHEGPQSIRWKFVEHVVETVLEDGMVLSNEPGVYKEGKYGIRTENIMYCTKKGKSQDGQFMKFETLTFVPIDCEGIDIAYLTKEDRMKLNEYHSKVYEELRNYLTEEEKKWLFEVTKEI